MVAVPGARPYGQRYQTKLTLWRQANPTAICRHENVTDLSITALGDGRQSNGESQACRRAICLTNAKPSPVPFPRGRHGDRDCMPIVSQEFSGRHAGLLLSPFHTCFGHTWHYRIRLWSGVE
jgi:hypothetical protein